MTKIHTIGYLGDKNKNYEELENILSVDELVYYFIHAANVYQYNKLAVIRPCNWVISAFQKFFKII